MHSDALRARETLGPPRSRHVVSWTQGGATATKPLETASHPRHCLMVAMPGRCYESNTRSSTRGPTTLRRSPFGLGAFAVSGEISCSWSQGPFRVWSRPIGPLFGETAMRQGVYGCVWGYSGRTWVCMRARERT